MGPDDTLLNYLKENILGDVKSPNGSVVKLIYTTLLIVYVIYN